MTLTDEELDALARRLFRAWPDHDLAWPGFNKVAREAARWAEERKGEVVWEVWSEGSWCTETSEEIARELEANGYPVRAIRVIATTAKGV